jgi:hypothetical protein
MPKVVYNSHGWVVKSYQSILADCNYRVVVERESSSGGVTGIVQRVIRMYGPKPPVPGELVSLHVE